MSVSALRHLMQLMRGELHQFIADSFYEVLLNAQVHVPVRPDGPQWVLGPGGQRALPIFLDREALVAWAGPEAQGRVLSVPQAAAVAVQFTDAWLAVDFGSPLNQPIARAGVEALANKSYPGAQRYAEQWGLVNQLAASLRSGRLDQACRERAEQLGFYTLGMSGGARESAPGSVQVFATQGMSVLSIRGPDGESYLPGWPSPGGSFEYLPAAPNRLVLPLATLMRSALQLERGLVLGLPSPYISLPYARLRALLS
jgi:hypothetical protein